MIKVGDRVGITECDWFPEVVGATGVITGATLESVPKFVVLLDYPKSWPGAAGIIRRIGLNSEEVMRLP